MISATDPIDLAGPALAATAREHGTPVWVYDAEVIRQQLARLAPFDTVRYAQKAWPNLHGLRLMRAAGAVVDAVSLGEVERALAAGFTPGGEPAGVVLTADLLDRATLARAVELDLEVNAGSPQMLDQIGREHPGHRVWIRVNPGFGHGHSRKTNTGGEHSKHGIWHVHLDEALALVDRHRLELVGLHMHIGSGADYSHLEQVGEAMVAQVRETGRDVEAISAGGGLPVPYRPEEPEVDTERYFAVWDAARREIERDLGHPVRLEIEPGRFLVAQAGTLVAEVRAVKDVGSRRFVLVDAGFNELMRPAMYGSYHRITVLAPDGTPRAGEQRPTVVGGPLCESGDVFTQDAHGNVEPMPLPEAEVGDLIAFHDAGAYGSSMSSSYNSRPLAAEVMLDGGQTRLVRRRQAVTDVFALELPLPE